MTQTITKNERFFRCRGSVTRSLEPSRVVATGAKRKAGRGVPLFIPADQTYYWSSTWQDGEAESKANLKAGNARTFDNPLDAIRHLLDDC
jgi:hypothetical protein